MTENKGDLISREALKAEVALMFGDKTHITESVCELIDNAPTVEAYSFERVQELVKLNQQFAQEIENLKRLQGEWIENLRTFCWECSECGNSALYNKIGVKVESQFCPNCGADMGGKEE